jgi:hypothetical protein
VQPDGTPTTSANENSGSSESLPAAVVETAGLTAAASTTSQLAALVKEHDGDAQTQEYHEPGIFDSQLTGNTPEDGSLVAQATLPRHEPAQQETNSSTADDDFGTSDSQPSATPEYLEAEQESSPNTQYANTSALESETAANLAMLRDSQKEGKPTSEVDGAIPRLLQPPPHPAFTGVPFPGWDHPELMEHFQQHMKSIGFDNPSMVKEFVEHRKAMQDTSGERMPLSGIKRKGPEKRTSSTFKAKKTKTRRTKTKKSPEGAKEFKIEDKIDVSSDVDSVSGIFFP